jgi:ketosteroid isomerase-like protein
VACDAWLTISTRETAEVSEGNIELHRRAIEAYNAYDLEAFIAIADPSIEFHSLVAEIGGVYQGHDGLRRFLGDLEDAWAGEVRLEPEAFFDLGEHTLAFQVLHGRGKESGAEVAMPVAAVMRWRDGRCVYIKVYTNREDALMDLGVSEDALEPIAP